MFSMKEACKYGMECFLAVNNRLSETIFYG